VQYEYPSLLGSPQKPQGFPSVVTQRQVRLGPIGMTLAVGRRADDISESGTRAFSCLCRAAVC
jgi:hypothetical protein